MQDFVFDSFLRACENALSTHSVKNGAVKLTKHFKKQISKHLGIWGFAPSPHQRAFRFRLFVSATGSNNRKPLWKPSGTNTSFYFRNICVVILTVPLPVYRGNIRNFGYFFLCSKGHCIAHARHCQARCSSASAAEKIHSVPPPSSSSGRYRITCKRIHAPSLRRKVA